MSYETDPFFDRNKFLLSYFEEGFRTPPTNMQVVDTLSAEWLVRPYTDGDRKLLAVRVSSMDVVDTYELNLDNPGASEHLQSDANAESDENEILQIEMGMLALNTQDFELIDELIDVLVLFREIK